MDGNDGFAIETTPSGHQIAKALLDNNGNPPGAGALFGLAFVSGQGLYYVDDATNTAEPGTLMFSLLGHLKIGSGATYITS